MLYLLLLLLLLLLLILHKVVSQLLLLVLLKLLVIIRLIEIGWFHEIILGLQRELMLIVDWVLDGIAIFWLSIKWYWLN
jgi:hypothetical protein